MIGRSVKMREMFARLEKLAKSDATVLVTGETGVGKELVAEALHDPLPARSGRVRRARLRLDPAEPDRVRAVRSRARCVHRGDPRRTPVPSSAPTAATVFLDEIGELPARHAAQLLRVLERKEVRRVGGAKTIEVDLRVVAATNRDLGVESTAGGSARTCTTGSPWHASTCRRSASARMTCRS